MRQMRQISIEEWLESLKPKRCINCKHSEWRKEFRGERMHGLRIHTCNCESSPNYNEPTLIFESKVCDCFEEGKPKWKEYVLWR